MNPAVRQLLLSGGRVSTGALVSKLFAAGAQGGVYEPVLRAPNVQRSLFEFKDGGDVATTAGVPIGFLLDQSGGLTLGPEIVFTLTQLVNNSGTATDNGNGTYTLTNDARARFTLTLANMINGGTYQVDLTASNVTGRCFWDFCDQVFNKNIDTAGTYNGIAQRATYDATFRFVELSPQVVDGRSITFTRPVVRRLAGNHMVQGTAASRPLYLPGPDRIVYDGVDDSLVVTFASSLGSDCTVVRSIPNVGASVLTGQTIGTSYTDSTTHCGLLIINRALTSSELRMAVQWANDRAFYTQPTYTNLACWGDSLTFGDQDYQNGGYPRRLGYSIGRDYYNGGVGGETSTSIKTRVLADAYGRSSWVNIFWLGRNNATDPTTVKADIASCVSNLASGNERYLVLSVLTASGDAAGTISTINALNSDLATLYGSRYLDVLAYLQTKGDGSANDNADIAAGLVPRSLRVDTVHLNGSGYQHVADCVAAKLRTLGY